jgi:hypothetical protein
MTIASSNGIPGSQPLRGVITPWVVRARDDVLNPHDPIGGHKDAPPADHCCTPLFCPNDPGTLQIVPSLREMVDGRKLRLYYLVGTQRPERPNVQDGFDIEPAPLLKQPITVVTFHGRLQIEPCGYADIQGQLQQRWLVELHPWE